MIRSFDDEALKLWSSAGNATLFGNAAAMFSGCDRYNRAMFRDVAGFVATAVRHRQIKCYFDEHHQLVGAIAWMWVTEMVLARLAAAPEFPPMVHISEWREGAVCFVPALVAHRQSLHDIIREVQETLPTGAVAIAWLNHRTQKLHVIPVSRARCWGRTRR